VLFTEHGYQVEDEAFDKGPLASFKFVGTEGDLPLDGGLVV
jgi:hypothetical protein